MSEVFKVVCTSNSGAKSLVIGKVYSAEGVLGELSVVASGYDFQIPWKYFLRLPEEPKTCADMTMEEYLAMVCLRATPDSVEYSGATHRWLTCSSYVMPSKCSDGRTLYRIKPEKSVKDVEIERIEKEMRKLADDLAKIKEK